jgi:uncharacterized protein (DUF58 family)
MIKFLSSLYPGSHFLYGLAIAVILLVTAFALDFPPWAGLLIIGSWLILLLREIYVLYGSGGGITGSRILSDRLSNGDENTIEIKLSNYYYQAINITVLEELPFQFQIRNQVWKEKILGPKEIKWTYHLRPVMRGKYQFGNTLVYVSTRWQLWERKFVLPTQKEHAVYPSFLQMSRYELLAFGNQTSERGLRKLPRRGVGLEFDQIKKYHLGDDPRQINWRASARQGELMVNNYTEEKSQNIYQVVDKGRLMQFPFEGMYLLDYAINSALMLSNIVLKKGDKAGLVCFDKVVSAHVAASRPRITLHHILEKLYHLDTEIQNADHARLASWSLQHLSQRSVLFIYTHFVNYESYLRKEKYIHSLSTRHLVIVIMFTNTGVNELIYRKTKSSREIYEQVLAEQQAVDQMRIQRRLRSLGVECVLTTPQNLSVDSLNKYLELKAIGRT